MLLFGGGLRDEWKYFAYNTYILCSSSRMEVIISKSSSYSEKVDGEVKNIITTFFPFKFCSLREGFKHLGYFLKPGGYRVKNWLWLVEKFEKIINH